MGYKKKKDAMSKEEMAREIEFLKVEIKRKDRKIENLTRERDDAERRLAMIPAAVVRFFSKDK